MFAFLYADITSTTGTTTFNWGLDIFKYTSKAHASEYCVSFKTGDSIAYVHIFGSNATGPYYKSIEASKDDPFVDSELRITKAISLYLKSFGTYPDRIILQTEKWDVQYYYQFYHEPKRYSELWNMSITSFNKNIRERLKEILVSVPPYVDVGIRTAPWEKTCGELLDEFNVISR